MIKVVAKNYVRQNDLAQVVELYRELIELTRKEKGCIRYELYQDEKDHLSIAMIEEWTTKEDLERHLSSDHFLRLVPQIREHMQKQTDMEDGTAFLSGKRDF